MSFWGKIKEAFGPVRVAPPSQEAQYSERAEVQPVDPRIVARYEGSYSYYGERSLIPATLQDARFDATPGVRMELARRSRYWERNSAIMNRLADLFEQYTVGSGGLRIIPNAGADEAVPADSAQTSPAQDWNKRAADWWAEFCRNPEIDTARSFGETQSLIARNWFVDGEIFVLKTKDKKGRPRLQLIESHRVATPDQTYLLEGETVQDGVELDASGAPLAYWVRQSDVSGLMALGNTLYPYIADRSEVFERIPAERILHIFEAVRPGMTRGLPFNYSVLNDLHDLEDLQNEEMKAVKSAADLANIWHTKTGEAPDAARFRNVNRTIQSQDANGNPVSKSAPIYYEVTTGGRDKYLKPGEDVKQFLTERPTIATQQFWDYLVAKICAGCGISRLLVAPSAPAQGTVVRSDLDTNARFFLARSSVLQKFFVEVYVWAMGWAKDWDRSVRGAPSDWDRVIIRPPRSVDVDVGRNSEARIAELNAGIRTRASVYAENGQDWTEEFEQIAKEQARARYLAKKYDVPVETILAPPKGTAPAPASPAAAPELESEPAKPVPVKVNGHRNGHINGHALVIPSRS